MSNVSCAVFAQLCADQPTENQQQLKQDLHYMIILQSYDKAIPLLKAVCALQPSEALNSILLLAALTL